MSGMRQIRSRRGVTIPEVLVAMVITVMIVGAAGWALLSVFKMFSSAGSEFSGYQQALTLQNSLEGEATHAVKFEVLAAKPVTNVSYFGFESDGADGYVFRAHAADRAGSGGVTGVTLGAVEKVELSVVALGARSRLDYVIHTDDGDAPYTLEGGIVLNNIAHPSSTYQLTPGDGKWLVLTPAPLLAP